MILVMTSISVKPRGHCLSDSDNIEAVGNREHRAGEDNWVALQPTWPQHVQHEDYYSPAYACAGFTNIHGHG